MPRRKSNIPENLQRMLKVVQPPETTNLYTTYGDPHRDITPRGDNPFTSERYQQAADDVLSRLSLNREQSLSIAEGGGGLGNTRRALQRIQEGAPITIYDIENLGQPRTGLPYGEEEPLFGITQLSLGRAKNLQALREGQTDVKNVVFRQPENIKQRLSQQLDNLERDYHSFYDLSDREVGSLADLATFSDRDLFGQEATIGGETYKTLPEQASPVATTLTGMTQRESIQRMRQGLENITDPELTTDPERIVDLMGSIAEDNPVLGGHNVERHDQPGLTQYLKSMKALEEILNFVQQPQVDTLRMSQATLNREGAQKTKNYQLGTLYETITSKPYGEGQAHNAGYDVQMNMAVFDSLYDEAAAGGLNQRVIESGQQFHVDRGIIFNRSSFNQNAGQYDMVTQIDPESGKHRLQYENFRRNTGRGSRLLEFEGEIDPIEIDGVTHYGVSFFNEEEDTHHHFLRTSRSQIDDLFEDYLVEAGNMPEDQAKYIHQDNVRRRYNRMFTEPAKNSFDTVSRRLESANMINNIHKEELDKLYDTGVTAGAEKKAIDNTLKRLEEETGYTYGRKRIEETVSLSDRLAQESELWSKVQSSAQSHAGIAEDPMARTQRENLYYRNVFNRLAESSEDGMYGYEQMEMLQLPSISNPGEITHRNVQSEGQIQAMVRNELGQDMERAGRGKTTVHFNRLMDTIGEGIDDEEFNHLQRIVHKDLRRGKVTQGTVDEVANTIYRKKELLKENGAIVNQLPGFDIERPFSVEVLQNGSDLVGKSKTEIEEHLHKETADFVDQQIARGSNKPFREVASRDVVERFKRSDEIQKQLRNGVIGTNESLGMQFGRTNLFSDRTAEQQAQNVVERFHNEGFQVRLDQVEGSDRLLLFATPNKRTDISSLSFSELEASEDIFQAPLPLYNERMSFDTPLGEMRDIQHVRIDERANINHLTKNDVRIESSSERMFQQIGYSPRNIRKYLERGDSMEEAIRKSESRLYDASTTMGIPSGYRRESADDLGYTASSRAANRHLMINQSEFLERYAAQNYPEVYEKYQANKSRGISDNILDAFGTGERSSFRQEAMNAWNQSVGDMSGVHLYSEGLNPNQASRGVMNLMPAQLSVPFPQLHSGLREQVNKTINYRTVDREPLERYFRDTFGEDSLQAAISTAPAQTRFANELEREDGIRAYEVNTLRVGNEALTEGTAELLSDYRSELDELRAKPGKVTPKDSQRIRQLHRNIDVLESGRISTLEDEFVLAEELMGSISSSEQIDVDLGPYELDDRLDSFLKENLDVDELPSGRIELPSELTMTDMQRMGIVNDEGMLSVGQLTQDVTIDGSGIEYEQARRRRLQKGATLQSVEIGEDGQARLQINNRYLGSAGNKTVRTASGARETSIGVPQEVVSQLGLKIAGDENIQAIGAFEKLGPGGRRGTGSAYTDFINTSSYNVAEAIDRLYTDGESGLAVVDDYFRDRELSGTRMTDYQDFIENKFIRDINDTLGSEQIAFNPDSRQPYEFISATLPGSASERQDFLQDLSVLATERYGMQSEEDHAIVRMGLSQQAIPYWQGTNVKARYGRVELNLLDQLTLGPTEEQVARIQSMGEIDGLDLSEYEGFSRRPGESLIARNLQHLSQTTGRPEEYAEYAQNLQAAREFQTSQQSIQDVQGQGNIIVDIAGTYEFDKDSNFLQFGEGDDQYTVVDGSRIDIAPKGSMATGAELQNTYSNLYSVDVYGEGIETTIGDLVEEQNSSVFAQMVAPDSPVARDAQLQNEVVQVVPMLQGDRDRLGRTFLQESESAQIRAFEAAYELAHGRPGEDGDSRRWAEQRIRTMQSGLTDFMDRSGRYLGSDASRDFAQIREANSLSFGLEGRNFLTSKYRPEDVLMNERQARTLITGRAQTILDANRVDQEELLEYGNLIADEFSELPSSEQDQLREDFIVDRIRGAADSEDDFNMYIPINRQPSQDEGSFLFGSLRIDNTMDRDDNSASLDPRLAGQMGGDFDGDIGYGTSYPYLEDMAPEEAIRLQDELQEMSEYTRNLALANNHTGMTEDLVEEGRNSFMELLELDDPNEVARLFGDNLTEENSMLQIMSDENMIASVGSIYNTVVGNRDAIQSFTDYGMTQNADNLALSEMRRISEESTSLMSKIQQSAIDRKKMTPQQVMNFVGLPEEYATPEGMAQLQEEGSLMGYFEQFDKARAEIPSSMQNITTESAPDIFQQLQDLDILSYGEEDTEEMARDLQSLTEIGQVNEAMSNSPIGGFSNPFLRTGFSTANENRSQFVETMRENPEQIPLTGDTESLAQMLFADEPEVIDNWQERSSEVSQTIADNFTQIQERGQAATTDFNASENLIQQLASSRAAEGLGDQIRSQSGLYNDIKETAMGVAGSTPFRAAAGIAAGWTVARAMRSGPTPEGNEAERETATAEEVAPSQLLTSPTARVAPQGQGVNLNIQATGNLSEEEVAGLINNEISTMTGAPMEMNMNVTDNTAKLDNKFYERVVNRTFGF